MMDLIKLLSANVIFTKFREFTEMRNIGDRAHGEIFLYNGNMIHLGEQIDDIASLIWETFMKPTYEICVAKGIEHAVQNSTIPALNAATKSSSVNGKHKQS